MRRTIQLPADAAGRLDRALADQLGLGRAAVRRAFALGEVRVRGRRARASDAAAPGAEVEIDVEGPAGPPSSQPDLPLWVLAESARLLVVDKPAGMAVHPLAPGELGTLANAVVARYPECAAAAPVPREGGALHRLDVETSGCVAFARDRQAWELVHPRLGEALVEKRYRALVAGRLAAGGVCSVPLAQRGGRVVPAPDPLAVDRLEGKGFRPRPAETHYEVERSFRDHTLVAVRLVTGVMHQIRAHLSYLGYPVAGDALYGGAAAALPGLDRHFLHASRLSIDVPELGGLVAESPLPPELERVLEGLAPEGG